MSTPWAETYVDGDNSHRFSSSVSEIVEEEAGEGNNSSGLFEINDAGERLVSIKEEVESSLFSYDVNEAAEDSVYVAVGKSESSMDALSWTLSHLVNTSTTTVYLIHVFPEIRHIPSPLGMLPKSQVSATQVENYMEQERGKRRQLLQKFLDVCSASKVKVDTMLVESDMVAEAILDLIPILNIRKLVVGTTNSNFNSRKLKSRRGIGIAHQILESAPNTCKVKVVCEGKEVIVQMNGSPSQSPSPLPSPSPSPLGVEDYSKASKEADDDHRNDSFACMCFKPKF